MAGIIVLPETAVPGTLAKDYYNIKSDYVLEVDITPNRADACSHYGVARDLYAYLVQNGKPAALKKPSVEAFAVDNHDLDIRVTVENSEACPHYAGVTVKGVTVKESPNGCRTSSASSACALLIMWWTSRTTSSTHSASRSTASMRTRLRAARSL